MTAENRAMRTKHESDFSPIIPESVDELIWEEVKPGENGHYPRGGWFYNLPFEILPRYNKPRLSSYGYGAIIPLSEAIIANLKNKNWKFRVQLYDPYREYIFTETFDEAKAMVEADARKRVTRQLEKRREEQP